MERMAIDGPVKKLDFLPYEVKSYPLVEAGSLHYERTFFIHRQVGAARVDAICPKATANERCPICEHIRTLPDVTEAERKILRDMLPKQRQLWLPIDLDHKDKGVQLWEYSFHNFGKLLKAILDADEDEKFIHFHDPDAGYSMRILFEEDRVGEKGRPFWKAVSIDFKKRTEPYPDELIDSLPCLDDLLLIPTYDELEAIFHHEDHAEGPAEISGKTEIDADAPWVQGNGDAEQVPVAKAATVEAAKESEFKDDDDWS
jgi:hypothetical protein